MLKPTRWQVRNADDFVNNSHKFHEFHESRKGWRYLKKYNYSLQVRI